MAIENLQKNEGITSHKSSLLNSHVSCNRNLQPLSRFGRSITCSPLVYSTAQAIYSSLWFSCAAQSSPFPRKNNLQKVPWCECLFMRCS